MEGDNGKPRATSFWAKYRNMILVVGIVLFLPPLAVLVQLTGDVNFCGRWCPRMFFVWREGTTMTAFLMGFVRSYVGVALVATILATTLAFGRYWCSHVCPVASPLEFGSRLVPSALKLDFSKTPAPSFRYAYLSVYLIVPAIGIGSLCCSYCNFAAIPRLFAAPFSEGDLAYFLRFQGVVNFGLLLFLGVFAKGGRAYCNLLCPIGALDALSNRIGAKFGRRVRIDLDNCTNCGECSKVCPTWAIDTQGGTTINQLSCMPCRLCQGACPTEAIYYGKPAS
ncbi:MAG: 4Fe-4S binding protein [Acidobacteria bacterium]|nr:4Fe-4S binding protein [Candidatus Sulfomarinibacter kjeldsenii]